MTAQVLFFNVFSKKDPHLNRIESLHSAEALSESCPTSKQAGYLIGGNYCHKKIHLRCLKRFRIRCCLVNHKNNQTAEGKYKPHGNFKASYTSVLNH